MSGGAAVNYILSNAAAVIAVVPAARILTGPSLPVGTALPAILVRKISGDERLQLRMADAGTFRTERVQVTALADTYGAVGDILELARAACVPQRGTFGSVVVDSILPAGEGPDLSDQDADIYEQSRDFFVRWTT